jgi:hypothetical protein
MQQEFGILDRLVNLFSKKTQQKLYFDTRINYQINKGEVYIDTNTPYDLYNTIPQLKTPIDKLAAMFSNGVFKYQNVGSDKLEPLPTDIAKLLENPNILQGQNPFLNQYLRQLIVYGNQFIYKNSASKITTTPQSILNISPAYVIPKLTGKLFDQVKMDGIVSGFDYNENGSTKNFKTNEVLWSKISDLDNNLIGYSPIKAMKYPLSNTVAAYQYLNCISTEKGGIGVLSSQSKDAMGALPMTPEEKKELEQTYRNENGIEDNQKKIHITTGSVTWSPMSYPTKDLLLMEQIDANFLAILNVLGVNQNLFVNSTYENLKNGLIQTHNDTVVVYADGFTQALSKFIGVPEGYRLVLDYSHLPYLQADKKTDADTFNVVSNGLSTLVTGGIITPVQANQILTNQFGIIK